MSTDYKTFTDILESQRALIARRDQMFYHIDRFERAALRSDQYAPQCDVCRNHSILLQTTCEELASVVNGTPDQKRRYEKNLDQVLKHLRNQHHIFPYYYYVSLYSFYGLAAGTALGLVSGLIFSSYFTTFLICGILAGWITGYFLGNRFDLKTRAENRII
jgi:hypothetical protein